MFAYSYYKIDAQRFIFVGYSLRVGDQTKDTAGRQSDNGRREGVAAGEAAQLAHPGGGDTHEVPRDREQQDVAGGEDSLQQKRKS